MTRTKSHLQKKGPLLEYILEYILGEIRFRKVEKYIENGSIVADLGCGYNGNFLRKISQKIKLGVGFDISLKHSSLPNNIVFKKTNLDDKFENNGILFDYVTALAVLEHMERPEEFIKNIKSILKKGGRLIITTPHKRGKRLLELLSKGLGLISKYEIVDHKNYYDEYSIKKLFKSTKLKIEQVEVFEFGYNLLCIARRD
jgi:2-polyprenyl-3-methyl-5-hydroxy-6-metoxy-1,4-benzoquinol methylase